MFTKKFCGLFAVLILFVLPFVSCSGDELAQEAKIIESRLENTEWRTKMDTTYYVDKKTHYKVLKFLPNRIFRFGDADSGGMIYRIIGMGFYRIDAENKLIILEGNDRIRYYITREGRLMLYAESYDFQLQ